MQILPGGRNQFAEWIIAGEPGEHRNSSNRLLARTPELEAGWNPGACAMDPQVSNGAGLRDEHFTELLVFGFLQNCSKCNFHNELELLGHDLPQHDHLQEEQQDELQTDGNRCSYLGREERDSENLEEIIQDIARQLAQVGDRMDRSIHPALVDHLAVQFMNVSLLEEDRTRCLSAALEEVMQTCPKDLEEEKTVLLLAMMLAKKVADHTPSLLRGVFRTAVNFINQNLFTYVRNLVRNRMD
nr:BH3-interacting domain death agonist isoform X2 [Manis javanica]